MLLLGGMSLAAAAESDDVGTAISLADLLRSARTVISANQARINDPSLGDKGLSGDAVLGSAIENDIKTTGFDPRSVDPASPRGKLLADLSKAIKQVMDANQKTINRKGMGFKGFVPAVFGRLVTEQFQVEAGDKASIKVTAPPDLVRNRKAAPDEFETRVIAAEFSRADWPKDKIYSAVAPLKGRQAMRVLVPEYYGAGCLSCHGAPKGEIDITGYPKEGAKLGDLGGVISISIFQ
ncbi:MAG TPA: DUF3365 domain-containing protein [Candidatus Sulfotelmatobacter sp.]|nr:DUF3365 domain-containing protein [Candidatus Sulfotelmatobacter sp.]